MSKTALEYGLDACHALMNQYKSEDLPPKGAFFYHQGVFLSGMQRIYELTGDRELFNYIKNYVDSVIGPNGELYGHKYEIDHEQVHVLSKQSLTMLDCKQPSILLYGLYDETGEEKYLNAVKDIAKSMYYWPVNRFGGYWHMITTPHQMWMDGAYMVGPLSVMYAHRFGDTILRERAINQVFIMDDHMKDEKTGLYYHGWDDSKAQDWAVSVSQEAWADPKTGLSSQIWGRAVGWYAVAILDMLDYIPEKHPAVERLCQIERDLLDALMKVQDKKSGLWFQVLDEPECGDNWIESSCSNLFIYSYAKALRKGIIDKKYAEVLEKAYQGIIDILYYENGNIVIDKVCAGTCIEDGSYEHYINRPTIKNDLHGAGAFILMCSEMEKYERNLT